MSRALMVESAIALMVMVIVSSPASARADVHIRIDQFGYRPGDAKVAILRNPLLGYDAPNPYVPGAIIEVRRAVDGSVAFAGPPAAWNGGATHGQSGDKVWWVDFSALTEPGAFYIHDPANAVSSEVFRISADVYRVVRRQAVRMYYYQRCGIAKAVPFAEPGWADSTPCHGGANQDHDCRLVTNPIPATSRDLSGGWHDAGDYNKYVNFANDAVHSLLDAYEIAPTAWTDDFGLPESGNGIADLLDEVRWELEWLLRMQTDDGSVLHKLSVTGFQSASPPSADTAARFYGPPTASATASACGMFAHAAHVFAALDDPNATAFAQTLEAAAVQAWDWLEANPGYSDYDNSGFSSASAELDHYAQEMTRLRAAAHLLKQTGDGRYRTWFDAHYENAHLFTWGYAMSWEETAQTGLLRYATLAEATPFVADDILDAYEAALSGGSLLGEVLAGADPYRAHLYDGDYTWGSNRTKCIKGEMYAAMPRLGLDAQHANDYRVAAADFLHYIHGVNPTGFCFLTHMDDYGADDSLREMYHAWFADGTVWDSADTSLYGPAPGYLTGGVNPSYQPDGAYQGPPIVPPEDQPIQKSYRDWNTGWPENSWELSECHIPYQAAYVRLLASHAGLPGDLDGDGCVGQPDLGVLLGNYGCDAGAGSCPGDVDEDGDTDQADLGALLAVYGTGCP